MSGIEKHINYILEAGIQAPSFYNSQPWKFEIKNNTIAIYFSKELELSLYDWSQIQSILSIGAVIENMTLASGSKGFSVQLIVNHKFQSTQPIATLNFEKNDSVDPSDLALEKEIRSRHSNYYQFKPDTLSDNDISIISEMGKIFPEVNIKLFNSKEKKEKIFQTVSYAEQVRFSRSDLHNAFHKNLHWNLSQAEINRRGFTLDSLGLCGIGLYFFKIIKSWPAMKFFNFFGFHQTSAKNASLGLKNSSAIGIISVPSLKLKNLVNAGRCMQRVWLKATELQLALQPHSTICIFDYIMRFGNDEFFDKNEKKVLSTALEEYKKDFQLNYNDIGVFMFRIGHPQEEQKGKTLRSHLSSFLK